MQLSFREMYNRWLEVYKKTGCPYQAKMAVDALVGKLWVI